jgi:hypothetical protein
LGLREVVTTAGLLNQRAAGRVRVASEPASGLALPLHRGERAILGDGLSSRSWTNIEQALVTVPPADQVRRRSVRPDDLDDLAATILLALMTAFDGQLVPYLRLHECLLAAVMSSTWNATAAGSEHG